MNLATLRPWRLRWTCSSGGLPLPPQLCLLRRMDIAECEIDQPVVQDLETAGNEEWDTQCRDAKRHACERRRDRARRRPRDIRDPRRRRTFVHIDHGHG